MKVTVGEHSIEVRGLVRGEIKKLRKAGFPLETVGNISDFEKRDEGLDRIFGIACKDFDSDQLTQGEALELWAKVVGVTYGGDELEKKSGSPQSSPSAKRDSGSTAKHAKKAASNRKGTARK